MKNELRKRRRQQLKKLERQGRRQPTLEEGEVLTRLRGLLYEGPSARTWGQITEAVDAWPDGPELEVALSYLEAHLEGWPDALRVNSGRAMGWMRRLFAGLNEPRIRLLRALSVSPEQPLDPLELRLLSESPWTRHLTALLIHQPRLLQARACLEELLRGQRLPRLTTLELDGFALDAQPFEEVLAQLHGGPLRRLLLRRCDLHSAAAGLARVELPALEELILGEHLSAEAWRLLGDAPWWGRLTRLELRWAHLASGRPLRSLLHRVGGMPRLEHLRLEACGLQAADVRAVIDADLPALRTLDVRSNLLTLPDLLSLLRRFPDLEEAAFSGDALGIDELFEVLAAKPSGAWLPSLMEVARRFGKGAEGVELTLSLLALDGGDDAGALRPLIQAAREFPPRSARRLMEALMAQRPWAAWSAPVQGLMRDLLNDLTVPELRAWMAWRGHTKGLPRLRHQLLAAAEALDAP